MNDILRYNMINPTNAITPNYDLSDTEVVIEFRINHLKNLAIIGRIDNNYICWFSRTSLDDKETNARIFDYLLSERPETVSNEYHILPEEDYIDYKTWFKGRIYRTADGMWNTPFGISCSQKDKNGERFAKDINSFFDEMQKKCRYRYDNGKYVKTLDEYYKKLSGGMGADYYYDMLEIREAVENEEYLILAENDDLREAYIKCMQQSYFLYCSYMNEVK